MTSIFLFFQIVALANIVFILVLITFNKSRDRRIWKTLTLLLFLNIGYFGFFLLVYLTLMLRVRPLILTIFLVINLLFVVGAVFYCHRENLYIDDHHIHVLKALTMLWISIKFLNLFEGFSWFLAILPLYLYYFYQIFGGVSNMFFMFFFNQIRQHGMQWTSMLYNSMVNGPNNHTKLMFWGLWNHIWTYSVFVIFLWKFHSLANNTDLAPGPGSNLKKYRLSVMSMIIIILGIFDLVITVLIREIIKSVYAIQNFCWINEPKKVKKKKIEKKEDGNSTKIQVDPMESSQELSKEKLQESKGSIKI